MRRMGSFMAGQFGGRRRQPLGRPALALSAVGPSLPQPHRQPLRRQRHPEDMTIQDWAMTLRRARAQLRQFDRLCGVSGKAGNLRGQKVAGGNVFEGPRSNEYPNPPLKMTESALIFEKAGKRARLQSVPATHQQRSRPYTNIEGLHDWALASIAATATKSGLRGQCQGGAAGLRSCRCCAPSRSSRCAHVRG